MNNIQVALGCASLAASGLALFVGLQVKLAIAELKIEVMSAAQQREDQVRAWAAASFAHRGQE